MVEKRKAIEVRMLASLQAIENASIFAEKALGSAVGRRIQELEKPQNVRGYGDNRFLANEHFQNAVL